MGQPHTRHRDNAISAGIRASTAYLLPRGLTACRAFQCGFEISGRRMVGIKLPSLLYLFAGLVNLDQGCCPVHRTYLIRIDENPTTE